MNEFDISKLNGIRINLKWSTVVIVSTIFANSIYWSFKFGNYFNEQSSYIHNTRGIVEKNTVIINTLRADIISLDRRVSVNTAEIANIKKQIK